MALAQERGTVTVPPTIQALLAARLERLASEERELLEHGAIEGEVFHRLAIRALAGERPAAEVESRLAGLVRKELIRPHPATMQGDDAFRFRHLLIRDAAYDGLPKAARAELHERFARWLEESATGLAELDEIAGWHLEQAVRYQRELGREVGLALAERAAEHLYTAGRRAGRRGDVAAARNLLERALALAPESSALHSRIAVDLAEQLIQAGELIRVEELLSVANEDPDTAGHAALVRLEWLLLTRPDEATQTIEAMLPGMLEQLTSAGDERGLAKAHMAAAMVHWLASRAVPTAEEARLSAQHARNAGDEGLRAQAIGTYFAALMLGPYDARTIAAELELSAREESGPYHEAGAAITRAWIERLEGRFDEARRLMRQGIESFSMIGSSLADGLYQVLAEVELTAGDLTAALAALKRVDAALAKQNEHSHRSTVQADLAEVSERLGDREAALAAIELSDQLSAPQDVINYTITHRVRARLALAEGDGEQAERWVRSAVDNAFVTDFVLFQAHAKLELARVLSALGRSEEAAAEAHAALGLYEAKGDRPGCAQARGFLAELGIRA